MGGWKTWLAALVAILYGIIGLAAKVHGPTEAMEFILYGLGLVGLGHKIEKLGGGLGRND